MLTDRSRIARLFARKALCSSLAIATALIVGPGVARAQSLQGNGTFASGTGTIGTATGTTTVNITSSDAVIDWTTFDTAIGGGPINFQPTSTTATFQSALDFSVLNRIIPTDPSRAIQFNGTVIGQIQGTTTAPGGSVYFYSPGGVIVGSTAVFNVGNLGLTSIAPAVVGGVFEQPGAPGDEFVQFNGAVTTGSAVLVQAGAQINATGAANNSYVALVAPVVDQRGTINVNGQAALVSADAVTMTFRNSGLFDIQVTLGTSGNVGGPNSTLFNSGAITGPVSSGAGDNHRVYMVAVPKNTAITLGIAAGSQLGFNIAGAADVVGNAVVLSAGKDIVAGNIATGRSAGGGTGAADLNIANTAVTSSLRGASTDETFFFSIGGGTASTASTVNLQADRRATYTADGAGSVTTGNGLVTLDAQRNGNGVAGGQTDIFAINNGSLTITSGGATLNSRGFGDNGATPGAVGGNATGGLAIIQAVNGGDVVITGPVNLFAGGFGGSGNAAAGGNGTGGLAQIFARDAGSSITINGLANLAALGAGGVGNGAVGGIGTGGQAFINAQVAASAGIIVGGAATIQANGIGGNANSGPAGAGIGGNAVAAASVNNNVSFGNNLDVFAIGQGGNATGGNTGSGTGGTARINLFSTGTVSVTGTAQVNAVGSAGMGNPNSALGTGNIAAVTVQQNSTLNVSGSLQVFASGLGDRSFAGVPTNGAGIGGTASVDAFTNGAITVGSVLRTRSDATSANGGNATAGTVIVAANSGGDITANELNISTDGVGGNDTGTGAGFGRGGTASLVVSGAGSTVTITNGNSTGNVNIGELDFISAEGFGGQNNGGGSGVGGAATGGTSSINVNNGAVLTGPANTGTQGSVRVIARATGGNANTGATVGGFATAGTINITVNNATMTSANLLPSAFALGGSATAMATGNITGGNAVGGTRNITVINGGSLTTQFSNGGAGAAGGNGSGSGRGGNASGGSATLTVDNGSTLSLNGSSAVFADTSGGRGGATGMSGNATGGSAFVRVANASTLSMAGPATNALTIHADAVADATGNVGPAPASLTGSNSTGGNSTFVIENATANLQTVTVSANGVGGGGLVAQGGNGTGGTATLQMIGATLNADVVSVNAVGVGGSLDAGQSGVAGNATGGLARMIATGGTNIGNFTTDIGIAAAALGGNIGGAAGTTAGSAVGGRAALMVSNGASLTLNTPDVFVDADTRGGAALSGVADFGGDGTGGLADVFANGGNLTINGNLGLDAGNDGGEGLVGGDGLRRTDGVANALLRAQNGTVTVTGLTTLVSVGESGSGGSANGGLVIIDPQNSLAGPSTITLNNVILNATAVGGNGAAAPSPSAPGGEGGDAFGGQALALGSAGNGRLVINGSTLLDASATGGTGGTGHPGATGTAGGRGGDATGGNIQFGTKSGFLDTGTVNTGSARFGTVTAQAKATGGAGGLGGSGTTQGVGGAGGDAFGGGATLLVRGSPVTITAQASLFGDARGGNGGAGSTQGAGGNALVGDDGGVAILATSRFMQPTQLGSLTAPGVVGTAFATGGAGSTVGAAVVGSGPISVTFDGASGTVGTIDLEAGGTSVTGTLPSLLLLNNATVDIANALSLVTPGDLSVSLGSSTLNVGNLTLDAGSFVLAAVRPTTLGTINVSGTLAISSALDFLAYANFTSAFGGTFDVDGSVLTGDLTFNGPLDIAALGSITTGNIQASDVTLAAGAAIATGAVTTGGTIDLVAVGAITTGQLTAGDTVEANAGGALIVAGASAGLVNPSTDPLADYNVGLRSLTSVVVGNVSARANFGVSSPGSIAVGNVNVGQVFLALPGTSLTTGSLTTALTPTSRVYIGNFSMEALGGQVASSFNPAPILALAPVATGGPIAINGPVSTITIQANTLQSITATGAIQTPGATVLVAGTTINTADIAVGDRAIIAAAGNITLGNVNAGITIPSNGLRKIAIGSGSGSVTTGNLASVFDLGIQAAGSISTGTLLGRQILLLAGTNVSTAAISALAGTQPVGQLYVGNFSMATPTANVFQPFQSPATGQQLAIFGLTPVRTGGSITFGGSVLAGNVDAAAGTGFTASAITASNDIDIEAGGLASVNGAWSSTDIDLISNDIAIASTGSLTATATGEILLASTNSAGMFVGDGLTPGSGYALSNDEFSRVRAGEIGIVGNDISNLATDLTIGNLTINATQLYGANGIVLFASGNRATETPSGILRIAGAVTANGFAPTTSIELLSGTVEIEAERGSLKVNAGQSDSSTSGSSSLGGLIYVEADRIHIASDAILTKLRADPLYTGHIDELNAPAAVQRPDGVFNALGFEINVGETFYVQNTGSRVVPAGFVTTFDNTDVFASGDRTGGVEIVINGQFQTSTGTVTGRAAFDQVIADPTADSEQFFGFSETSQLNGCVFLSRVCAFGQSDPVAAISSEISVIISPVLAASPPPPAVEDAGPGDSSASSSDSEAAAEEADSSDDEKKDEGDGDEAASPIAPPTPLISTRALDGEVNVVEPVSGAGNPALFGSAVDETTVQGEKP